jgi:hypothetical protein
MLSFKKSDEKNVTTIHVSKFYRVKSSENESEKKISRWIRDSNTFWAQLAELQRKVPISDASLLESFKSDWL